MSYRVLACDPGETTGWASGLLDKKALTLTNIEWGSHPWKEFGVRLWNRQENSRESFDIIVYEAWRLRGVQAKQLTGSDLQPVQCVGQIKAAAWWASQGHAQLVSQEPSIKPVIDKQMAALGQGDYLPPRPTNGEEHARDAVRHLWYFAINKYGVKP